MAFADLDEHLAEMFGAPELWRHLQRGADAERAARRAYNAAWMARNRVTSGVIGRPRKMRRVNPLAPVPSTGHGDSCHCDGCLTMLRASLRRLRALFGGAG